MQVSQAGEQAIVIVPIVMAFDLFSDLHMPVMRFASKTAVKVTDSSLACNKVPRPTGQGSFIFVMFLPMLPPKKKKCNVDFL